MKKRVAEMTTEEILGNRKWPAGFTTQQAREQMEHEEKGCPPPWAGAVWNGHNYVSGDPSQRVEAIQIVIHQIEEWQNAQGRLTDRTWDLMGDAARELRWCLETMRPASQLSGEI